MPARRNNIADDQINKIGLETANNNDYLDFDNRAIMNRFRKDLRSGASKMGRDEVKLLVKYYYQFQKDRIRTNNRIGAFETNNTEPVQVLGFFSGHLENFEKLMIVPLKEYVETNTTGKWLIQRKGIGPVLAAGLLAHLSTKRKVYDEPSNSWGEQLFWKSSSWLRFGGYDPTCVWEKGHRRPWNADLKVLFFKIGKSLVMTGKGDIYQELYKKRKEYAVNKNESGGYSATAFEILKRYSKNPDSAEAHFVEALETDVGEQEEEDSRKKIIETLKQGKLTAGHIDAQCRRWMVQIFISHLHTVMWETEQQTVAAIPYALAHLNPHQHMEYIPVPGYVPLADRHNVKDCPPHGIYLK